MPVSTGAALRIGVRIDDRCQLTFEAGDKKIPIQSTLNLTQLRQERDSLRADLEAVRETLVGSDVRTWPSVGAALQKLHLRGRTIVYRLFGEADIGPVIDLCRAALGVSHWPPRPGWEAESLAPHLIEVDTHPDYGIPYDMLPLLDFDKPPKTIEGFPELAAVASGFLGFSAVVLRTFGRMDAIGRRLRINNEPSLPMKLFWHPGLTAATDAEQFFRENARHFDIKGSPWPTSEAPADPEEFAEMLAEYLWDSSSRFDRRQRGRSDELCYLVCHCDTSAPLPDKYKIYLGTKLLRVWTGKREATLLALEDALRRRRKAAGETPDGPLVFLNACGSGAVDPFGATSFTKLFTSRNLGYMGFIGTEITVPDRFASRFGEAMHRHFVGGLPLGRALHAARWHLLRRHRDPFGLMYTLYADPEIETRNKVPELRANLYPRSAVSERPEPT
jgi:CHAT domain-containing protein